MSTIELFFYVIFLLFAVAYLFLKKKYSYFEERGIPHVKPSILFGNLPAFGAKHMGEKIIEVYEETKNKDIIAGFYIFVNRWVIVTDLELAKRILVKDFNIFHDRGFFTNEENEPLTGNLFAVKGEKWRFLRNKLSPALSSGKIKMMYNTISDKGETFVKALEKASESESVDIKDISNRFTIDIISNCAFGVDANTQHHENEEILQIFKSIFSADTKGLLRTLFIFGLPEFSKRINLKQYTKDITEFFSDVVGGTIRDREAKNIKRNDFLNMLIELKNKGTIDTRTIEGEMPTEARKLTLDECIAQSFIFFFAGSDTSSLTIAYAMLELGQNPEIQQKLRNEIIEKTAHDGISYDNLNDMPYLNQVTNEILRKYPAGTVLARENSVDYKVPGSKHVIEKGTQVVIPIIAIHHDERFWKNPHDFDPDRFSAEETAKRHNFAFMPFGEGPRNCIGMRFAQIVVKFAVATIIKNFKVTIDTDKVKYPLELDPWSPTLLAKGGFWVKLHKL